MLRNWDGMGAVLSSSPLSMKVWVWVGGSHTEKAALLMARTGTKFSKFWWICKTNSSTLYKISGTHLSPASTGQHPWPHSSNHPNVFFEKIAEICPIHGWTSRGSSSNSLPLSMGTMLISCRSAAKSTLCNWGRGMEVVWKFLTCKWTLNATQLTAVVGCSSEGTRVSTRTHILMPCNWWGGKDVHKCSAPCYATEKVLVVGRLFRCVHERFSHIFHTSTCSFHANQLMGLVGCRSKWSVFHLHMWSTPHNR